MSRTLLALVGVGLVSSALGAEPAPWPQFRGPGGSGVADEQKPPTQLGPDKNVAWKVAVPPGMSSPVVVGDKLVLTAFEGGKLLTLAYSRADGKELWRKEAPAAKLEVFAKNYSSPAASTPATDGERVVVYFGSCGLICYDLAGTELWKYELPPAETDGAFGSGTSPVVADGKAVLVRDTAKDARLIALDVKTGSRAWEVKRDGFKTAWSSPCVWDTPRGKQVVVPGTLQVKGYDLATGAEAWTVKGIPAIPCTTPVVADGKLFFAGWGPNGADFKMPAFDELLKQAGEEATGHLTRDGAKKTFLKDLFDNNDPNMDGKLTREEWETQMKFLAAGKNVAFALNPGGTGDITKSHVAWSVTKGLPQVPSPLVYRGVMYVQDMQGLLSAYDARTGQELYAAERVGVGAACASMVAANGHIYLCGQDKSVVVIKAGDSPDKVSATKLDDTIMATPAIADNTLYVRTGKTLYAFAGKK
jgi:outer membrane protein assembly factor BamB